MSRLAADVYPSSRKRSPHVCLSGFSLKQGEPTVGRGPAAHMSTHAIKPLLPVDARMRTRFFQYHVTRHTSPHLTPPHLTQPARYPSICTSLRPTNQRLLPASQALCKRHLCRHSTPSASAGCASALLSSLLPPPRLATAYPSPRSICVHP